MDSSNASHAIVIGGSMAGLLAARVLSDHFDRVTVIERDELPDGPDYRGGVPQARHLHTLLARGQRIMEDLFPGFAAEMHATGAPQMVWGQDSALYSTGGWSRRFNSGVVTNTAGRVSLEWLVRRRVGAINNITFLTGREVKQLVANDEKTVVTGAEIESRRDHSTETLYADLVVDASGRRSDAPRWLQALGYNAPEETSINAFCGYATRWFERPSDTPYQGVSIAIQARVDEGLYRAGGLMQVEGNRWVVTLIGANKDYPPTDEAGFLEFARSLASTAIYDLIKDARPVSPVYGYRRLENRMRHYERLARRPENFVVTGDAAVALNPIYGQGMSAAALEALELGKLLAKYNLRNLTGFAAEFQKQVVKVTDGPWLMATSEDLRYPEVEGDRPGFQTRLIHKYFDRVAFAMAYDKVVAKGFIDAMNLLKSPTAALMRPAVVLRVLRHNLLPHRRADMAYPPVPVLRKALP